jgi:hypothetical protein
MFLGTKPGSHQEDMACSSQKKRANGQDLNLVIVKQNGDRTLQQRQRLLGMSSSATG